MQIEHLHHARAVIPINAQNVLECTQSHIHQAESYNILKIHDIEYNFLESVVSAEKDSTWIVLTKHHF